MKLVHIAAFATSMLAFQVACVGSQGEEEESVGVIPNALEHINALNPNALNPNSLSPNALDPGALSPNALDPGALSPSALSAIRDPGAAGGVSRTLLRYIVGCALTTAQSFSFSWTESGGVIHDETYWGLLGIAPTWSTTPLNVIDQRWVSACIGARTNWYGTAVTISSRAPHAVIDKTGPAELSAYTHQEGAFWGNLFDATPYLRACYDASNRSYSRAMYRDCAAGHLDEDGSVRRCGLIEIVGSCDAYCRPPITRGRYYPSCGNSLTRGPDSTAKVITVYLP